MFDHWCVCQYKLVYTVDSINTHWLAVEKFDEPPKVFSIVWVLYVVVKSDSVIGSPWVSSSDGILACLSLTSRKYLVEEPNDRDAIWLCST